MNMGHVLDALRSGKPVSRSLAHEAARLIESLVVSNKEIQKQIAVGNELVAAVDDLLLAYTTTSYEKRIVALNRVFNAQDAWRKDTPNEQDQAG